LGYLWDLYHVPKYLLLLFYLELVSAV